MEKIHVKLNLPVNDITNLSWGEIINKANAHKISEKCIGQEKQITIGDETYDVVLIGVNHDNLADESGKATTTWQLKNCYNNIYYTMNSSNSNAGGYASSEMHTTHLPSIFNQIQEDVKSAIKPVIKKTTAGGTSTDIVDVNCDLFLLSEIELFGEINLSGSGEGTQYTYWQQHDTNKDRQKMLQGATSSWGYAWWWTRSPNVLYSTGFCGVASDGRAGTAYASGPRGVCFAFCI